MNLVPQMGRQIHLRKIPKNLLQKVLMSPRSELVPGCVCARVCTCVHKCVIRGCTCAWRGGAGVGEGDVPAVAAPTPLLDTVRGPHLLRPKLLTLLDSQWGAEMWGTVRGGGGIPFMLFTRTSTLWVPTLSLPTW